MPIIDFKESEFFISGIPAKTIANSLVSAGIEETKVAEILGLAYLGAVGKGPSPAFEFGVEISEIEPECVSTYSPQFTHIDWIDGESRVQAGMTAEEMGFNARFHSLENELTAIADQFEKCFGCIAAVRSDLFHIVSEIEAKITDLQNQIHNLQEGAAAAGGPSILGPGIGIQILGTTKLGEKEFLLAHDPSGFRIIEMAEAFSPPPTDGDLVFPPSGEHVMPPLEILHTFEDFSTGVITNPNIAAATAGGTTIDNLAGPLGPAVTGSGIRFTDIAAIVPSDTVVSSPEELIHATMEHAVERIGDEQARVLKHEILTEEAASRIGAALLNSSIRSLRGVDPEVVERLRGAGMGTIAGVVNAPRERLSAATHGLDPHAVIGTVAHAGLAASLRDISV